MPDIPASLTDAELAEIEQELYLSASGQLEQGEKWLELVEDVYWRPKVETAARLLATVRHVQQENRFWVDRLMQENR